MSSLQTPGNVLWPLTDHENTVRDVAVYDQVLGTTSIVDLEFLPDNTARMRASACARFFSSGVRA